MKQQHNELSVPANNVDPEEEAKDKQKLDLIMKRDQEMTAYIDRFEEVSISAPHSSDRIRRHEGDFYLTLKTRSLSLWGYWSTSEEA